MWFGPGRFGWGLSPVSPEGWAVTIVAVAASVWLRRRLPERRMTAALPAVLLVAVAVAKGTAPGGPWARQAMSSRPTAESDGPRAWPPSPAGPDAPQSAKVTTPLRQPTPQRKEQEPAGSYETMSKAQLYKVAQERDLEGRSKMTRPELIEALRSAAERARA